MRQTILRRRFLLFGPWLPAAAATNAWSRLRYVGGTIPAKVNRYDWNTRLTVTAGAIELLFAGRQTHLLAPGNVTAMAYGQKANRRVADMAALSVVATPLALFGILHKSRDHSLSIEFKDAGGQPGVVLLEIHKDSYRAVIAALSAVTGKKVENAP